VEALLRCSVSLFILGVKLNLDSQFYSFVPVNDVARELERVCVDNVNISSLRSYAEPFTLERELEASDPIREEKRFIYKTHIIQEAELSLLLYYMMEVKP